MFSELFVWKIRKENCLYFFIPSDHSVVQSRIVVVQNLICVLVLFVILSLNFYIMTLQYENAHWISFSCLVSPKY